MNVIVGAIVEKSWWEGDPIVALSRIMLLSHLLRNIIDEHELVIKEFEWWCWKYQHRLDDDDYDIEVMLWLIDLNDILILSVDSLYTFMYYLKVSICLDLKDRSIIWWNSQKEMISTRFWW